MKKRLLLAALGVLMSLALLAQTGCAGEVKAQATPQIQISQQPQGIWVSGTGEVYVAPDIATLRLGVSASDSTVSAAQLKAADAMSRVMKALADGGVVAKDIQTGNFSINQRTRWDDRLQTEIVTAYQVTNTVVAKIRQLVADSYTLDYKVSRIIEAVADAGGDLTRISGPSFSVEDPLPYYRQAREKAVADAQDKAERLAALTGVTLGKPTYVSEGREAPVAYESYRAALSVPAPAASAPPISIGENKITLSVQVGYAAVP